MAESAASVTMTFLSGADVEACVLRNDEILTAITESLRA
jgi:hypothetical protein